MTWREKVIVSILLIIARMLADDELAVELKHLASHINMARAEEMAV